MKNNFNYYGLFFNIDVRDKIIDFVVNAMPGLDTTKAKLHCNHCTLLYKTQYWNNRDLYNTLNVLCHDSNEYFITIDGIGWNDKALALRVKDVKNICANNTPHITILTFDNGKPFDSNKITKWVDIKEPFVIKTYLKRV